MLRKELHLKFLASLPRLTESKVEYVMMAHLRTSVLYWSLTTQSLLGVPEEEYTVSQSEAMEYLKRVYRPEVGGFAGEEGAHDAHLLFTLSALQIMKIYNCIGVDWFDADKCVQYILSLQLPSGAFMGDEFGEVDTRFSYCAVASLALLGRLDALDTNLIIQYIKKCQNFDGGYGAIPGSESHGGNVFCVVSLLAILGRLDEVIDRKALVEWLVWRQLPNGGLNGRPEKLEDVCYSWWIMSALVTLGAEQFIDQEALQAFILKCQDSVEGGFADRPGDVGDVFHTLFGVAGLSFIGYPSLRPIDSRFCLPK